MPDLSSTWRRVVSTFKDRLDDEQPFVSDFEAVFELVSVATLAAKGEPRFLAQFERHEELSKLLSNLLNRVDKETGTPFHGSQHGLEAEADEAESLKWTINELNTLVGGDAKMAAHVVGVLEAHAEECLKRSKILEEEEEDDDREREEDESRAEGDESFDVSALFADL